MTAAEAASCRTSGAPSLPPIDPSARTVDDSPRTFRDHRVVKQDGVRVQVRLPPLPSYDETTNGFCSPHDPRSRSALYAPRLHRTDNANSDQTVTRFRCLRSETRSETRLRDLSVPLLAPVRVRNNNSRCCCRMGWFKEHSNSRFAIFRASSFPGSALRDQRNSAVEKSFFSPQPTRVLPKFSTAHHALNRVCHQGEVVAGATGAAAVLIGTAWAVVGVVSVDGSPDAEGSLACEGSPGADGMPSTDGCSNVGASSGPSSGASNSKGLILGVSVAKRSTVTHDPSGITYASISLSYRGTWCSIGSLT